MLTVYIQCRPDSWDVQWYKRHETYTSSFQKHFLRYFPRLTHHHSQTNSWEYVRIVALSWIVHLVRHSDWIKWTATCKYAPTLQQARQMTCCLCKVLLSRTWGSRTKTWGQGLEAQGQGFVVQGQGREVRGQWLANCSSRTRTFLEDCQQDWVTMKMTYLLYNK